MTHEPSPPHSLVDEATNANTTPARLTELAKTQELQPYIAGNPNTPLQTLIRLAEDFPEEFLNNPVIPLLNLAEPTFFHAFTYRCWLAILTCENVPKLWLDYARVQYHKYRVNELAAMHIVHAGEFEGDWAKTIKYTLEHYKKNRKHPSIPTNETLPPHLFIMYTKLFPQQITVKNKWWEGSVLKCSTDTKRLLFTSLSSIPPKMLAKLSSYDDTKLRCHILRHPNTPERILIHFAKFPNVELRRAIAQRPQLNLEQLRLLAEDKDIHVRRLIAQHPRLHDQYDMLELLCHDQEIKVRQAIASRPKLPKDLIVLLSGDNAPEVRATLAHHRNLPADTFIQLTEDVSPIVLAAIASHPRLTETTMRTFAEHTDAHIRTRLAHNSHLPIDLIETLTNDSDSNVHTAIAVHHKLPMPILQRMALCKEPTILTGIARNPATPTEILTKLAHSPYLAVQAAVATNKRTPADTLRTLAYQEQGQFPHGKALARHKNTPLDVLENLLSGRDLELWCILLTHPTMRKLHTKPIYGFFNREVREQRNNLPTWFTITLLENRQTPTQLIEEQGNSWDWEERFVVAKHPKTSINMLQHLEHDGNRYVRAAARQALRKRRSQLDR